jgi:hypothetical protein
MTEVSELKPNLKKVSKEELDAIMNEALKALERGDRDSFYKILKRAPLSPGQAYELKRFKGIESLIAAGYNLSEAVAEYGEEWLHS